MHQALRPFLFFISASPALLTACNPAPVATDAGATVTDAPLPRPDGGPPPPPYACDGDVTVLNGVLGATESLALDISMTAERPRDLGPDCGNVATTAMWSGQEIIEYHVPGAGRVGVVFDTRGPGTAANFNTLVQLRTECARVPTITYPPTCFDDATSSDPRANGGFEAMGGDVVFLVVTAFSDPPAAAMELDTGPLTLTITPNINTPPVLATADTLLSGDAMLLDVSATDAEGPIVAYALSLYTAAGQVDFDGDGVREVEDVIVFNFDSVTGTAPQLGTHSITPMDDGYQIATFCRMAGCTEAGITVFDAAFAASALMRVPVVEATIVGPGAVCNRTNVCGSGLVCTAGVCELTPAAAALCSGATPIVIAMPVDAMPIVASATGSVLAGAGVFNGTCTSGGGTAAAATPGREVAFTIELTGTGPYNLTLTTARPATGATDTVLYVRRVCADESSTIGCSDDVGGGLQSTVNLTNLVPGTYFVFVEVFGGVASGSRAIELQATLTL